MEHMWDVPPKCKHELAYIEDWFGKGSGAYDWFCKYCGKMEWDWRKK